MEFNEDEDVGRNDEDDWKQVVHNPVEPEEKAVLQRRDAARDHVKVNTLKKHDVLERGALDGKDPKLQAKKLLDDAPGTRTKVNMENVFR